MCRCSEQPQRQISTPAKLIGMPKGSPTIGTLSKSPIITRIRPAITASTWLAILLPVSMAAREWISCSGEPRKYPGESR